MKNKKRYEAPLMVVNCIETESNFCGSAVVKKEHQRKIKTQGHQIGQELNGNDLWGRDKGWKNK